MLHRGKKGFHRRLPNSCQHARILSARFTALRVWGWDSVWNLKWYAWSCATSNLTSKELNCVCLFFEGEPLYQAPHQKCLLCSFTPQDGNAYTYEELAAWYNGKYETELINAYWSMCELQRPKPKTKSKERSNLKQESQASLLCAWCLLKSSITRPR